MQNYKSLLLGLCVCLGLAACGGGGGGSNSSLPPGGGGTQADTLRTDANFLSVYNPDGSPNDLFSLLYADENITLSTVRMPQSLHTLAQVPPKANTFKPNIAGGNATVATNVSGANPAGTIQTVAAISTYRDANGSCECSNDVINGVTYPPPYAATITNPNWNSGKPWKALAASDVLSTYLASKTNAIATTGTYTFAVTGDPGNTASFTVPHPDQPLARQTKPSIAFNTGNGIDTVSWAPAAGTKEYFLAFITHLGNNPANPLAVVGYIITDKPYAHVQISDLYAHTTYQMLLISASKTFVNSYFSVAQLPPLPDDGSGHLDFSMSQLTNFTTP
ncbi:MAG: hypothetical protein M3126_07450 [Candidatus Eremiobacteraeota bacterium]|nr:hypothetical protein [Candidatus Eremiobacteraeota bacterium]